MTRFLAQRLCWYDRSRWCWPLSGHQWIAAPDLYHHYISKHDELLSIVWLLLRAGPDEAPR